MELKLYETLDNENVINKNITLKYTINISLKKDVNINKPIIILNDNGVMDFKLCNYCFIELFNRYYFIRSLENVNNNIWNLYLECDVLESFKTDILNSVGLVNRIIREGDYQSINSEFDVRKQTDVYKSDVTLNGEKSIILTSIGGV